MEKFKLRPNDDCWIHFRLIENETNWDLVFFQINYDNCIAVRPHILKKPSDCEWQLAFIHVTVRDVRITKQKKMEWQEEEAGERDAEIELSIDTRHNYRPIKRMLVASSFGAFCTDDLQWCREWRESSWRAMAKRATTATTTNRAMTEDDECPNLNCGQTTLGWTTLCSNCVANESG